MVSERPVASQVRESVTLARTAVDVQLCGSARAQVQSTGRNRRRSGGAAGTLADYTSAETRFYWTVDFREPARAPGQFSRRSWRRKHAPERALGVKPQADP